MINMDNNNNHIATSRSTYRRQLSREEHAMNEVLNLRMMELRCINKQFHDICLYLCEDGNLQEFSNECGHNLTQWKVYDTMMKNQPDRLPAKTFLEVYLRNNEHITLRHFMRILLNMRDRQLRVYDLLKSLWNAALYGNSEYFRNMQETPHSP